MFWIIVAAIVIVGAALAWWSSGRAKPDSRKLTPEESRHRMQGKAAEVNPPRLFPGPPG